MFGLYGAIKVAQFVLHLTFHARRFDELDELGAGNIRS